MKRPTLDSKLIEYDTDKFGEKLPVVCEPCNSGWMSALTLKVKDRFGRAMLDGEPFTLGLRDATLLAEFTFMKAVVMNQSLSEDAFFHRDFREKFRTSLVIPPFVQCWLAAYERASMHVRSQSHIFSANPDHPLYGLQFCSFNYIVGKLALQLLAPRWKNIPGARSALIMIKPTENWKLAALRFWPDAGVPVLWPPPEYLGDDSIKLFVDRFGGTFPGY